jgi:hypothetical protein
MQPSEKVSISHKQFSEIVAEADDRPEDKTAYRFSNGRRFDQGAGAYEPEA